ncbi:MAG TPA: hypothetical protein VL688_09625 [Verrucomicrobiae bacterium]|jgi:hypothetical protein|nr:hypothetical protein [Verrucomicrobiae bacterium]
MKPIVRKISGAILLAAYAAFFSGCAPLWFAGGAATGAAVANHDDDKVVVVDGH